MSVCYDKLWKLMKALELTPEMSILLDVRTTTSVVVMIL